MKLVTPHEQIIRLTTLPPKSLRTRGFRLLLLDLDDLLMPREGSVISDEILHWIQKAKAAGLILHIISNSKFPRRVRAICRTLDIDGTAWSLKPLPFAFWRAIRKYGVRKSEAMVLGDQLFTDILGARLAGLYSIFIPPLSPERRWDRKIMRWLENIIRKKH